MRKLFWSILSSAFACSAFCGCVLADEHPATQPSTLPASVSAGEIVRLADAIAIEQLRNDTNEINLSSKLKIGARELKFGQIDVPNADGKPIRTTPMISFDAGQGVQGLPIDDPHLRDAGWSFIAQGPAAREIWAVLDNSLDARQRDLLILHSLDAGDTFAVTIFRKPDRAADYDSFAMSAAGHGRVTMFAQCDPKKRRAGGFYTFATTDDGKTWTGPTTEPDALQPADDADEEMDSDPTKAQKVEFHPRPAMRDFLISIRSRGRTIFICR